MDFSFELSPLIPPPLAYLLIAAAAVPLLLALMIRARGALTLVLAEEGDTDVAPYADRTITLPVVPTLLQPIVATVPLQLFACELATVMGHDVDQPRNLAKSVTVE